MDRYDDKVIKLQKEYLKKHPNAENPFKWSQQFDITDIYNKVNKANGRIVEVKEDFTTMDGGELIYID